MAAKRVGRKRGMGRSGRKPPLHIVSDFGSKQMHTRSRLGKVSKSKMTRSKGNFGAK
jgi:hypothetical protein